jgi:carbohydrate diacid regulator
MLSSVLAQQIAGETTEAIGHNVIITDADAMVIGSGDRSRVGTLHEASLEVMRTQESAWHNEEEARRLRGVRPGITLPLVVGGEAVGTVGITGSPRQVRRFGLLVRRQTEILLEESSLLRRRVLRELALEELVTEIVDFDPSTSDREGLTQASDALGFHLDLQRTPVLLEVRGASFGPEVLRTVRAVFGRRQDIVGRISASRCVVLAAPAADRDLETEATRMIEAIDERFGSRALAAVGEWTPTLDVLARDCRDLLDLVSLARREGMAANVLSIGEMRVQQALAHLPQTARGRLVDGAVGVLIDRPDWSTLRATIIAWCESGCNLVDTAATLNVHRNTVLYRLDKIESLVGRPWRDHRSMLALYVASLAASPARADRPQHERSVDAFR